MKQDGITQEARDIIKRHSIAMAKELRKLEWYPEGDYGEAAGNYPYNLETLEDLCELVGDFLIEEDREHHLDARLSKQGKSRCQATTRHGKQCTRPAVGYQQWLCRQHVNVRSGAAGKAIEKVFEELGSSGEDLAYEVLYQALEDRQWRGNPGGVCRGPGCKHFHSPKGILVDPFDGQCLAFDDKRATQPGEQKCWLRNPEKECICGGSRKWLGGLPICTECQKHQPLKERETEKNA